MREELIEKLIEQKGANESTCEPFVMSAESFANVKYANGIIQTALAEYDYLEIPKLDFPIMLDRPIVLKSGKHIAFDKETVIRMAEGCGGCFIRNESLINGSKHSVMLDFPDENIIIEGGIWDNGDRGVSVNDSSAVMHEMGHALLGVIFLENCRKFTVRGITVRHCKFDGVLINLCSDFVIEDIFFDNHDKDGIHVNGPACNGIIRRMHGKSGDDFVALNAWDWDGSAVSYGGIENILVEDIRCEGDEMRLLPGRKTYSDGTKTECPIRNCVFRRISGVYCVKLYQQPNCYNDITGNNDKSEIPGEITNVHFDDISLDALTSEGFGEIDVSALFEICADCTDISFRNIKVGVERDEFLSHGLLLSRVGTKSSTWKRGLEDPAQWCELFDTELICTADRLSFEDICFAGKKCTDRSTIIGSTKLTPNTDYPNTTPKGGNGYGILGEISIK